MASKRSKASTDALRSSKKNLNLKLKSVKQCKSLRCWEVKLRLLHCLYQTGVSRRPEANITDLAGILSDWDALCTVAVCAMSTPGSHLLNTDEGTVSLQGFPD